MDELKSYKAHGLVLGNLQGGGTGEYPAEELSDNNLISLKDQIEMGVRKGWLDSGMGFDGLIGALMVIETERKIIIDNVAYRNTTTKRYYTKGLTPKQKWFLSRCLY